MDWTLHDTNTGAVIQSAYYYVNKCICVLYNISPSLSLSLSLSLWREARTNSLTRSRSRGHTESDMTAELNAEYMDEVKKMIPLGRLGYASEVAGMCAFLVRPAIKTQTPKP